MPPHRSIILSSEQSTAAVPPVEVAASSDTLRLAGSARWHVRHQRLHGGPSDGIDVVEISNGPLSIDLLPTRGMGVWKAQYKDIPIGWSSPVRRPVHPRHVDLAARNGLGWLDGFNELICRCGLACIGPPGIDSTAAGPVESQLTLHGRIANIPAHHVEVAIDEAGPGTISVTGIVDECTMFGPRLRLRSTVSTKAGSNSFTISDEVENLGGAATDLQLLYHTNIGAPFLEEDSTLHCPARVIAPRDARAAEGIATFGKYAGPTPGYAEQVYYCDLIPDAQNETLVLLKNAGGEQGVSLHFDRDELPCFSVWKCTQAAADGYVTGLEPGTSFPNFKSFEREQGRVRRLAPGEIATMHLRMEVHDAMRPITALQERISALQIRSGPLVHARPTMPFSPG